jgi:uncharacterized integral membrane protein (TIGR00697 family)
MIMAKRPSKPITISRVLASLIGLSIAVLIISNIASVKITGFGPAVFDSGTILFPLAYIIEDIITEVYGWKTARMVVWIGFGCLVLMTAILLIVQHLPAGPGYTGQSAYNQILGFAPRISAASLVAYLIGEFLNITLLAELKARMQGKGIWARLVGSSTVGELFDTVIFSSLAFAGTMSGHDLGKLMITVYIIKVGFDFVASPFEIYLINFVKRVEGVDVYDAPKLKLPNYLAVPKS